MDWFSGKVSLGNFPNLSEVVNKISVGIKTIEKNFDNVLGLEDNPYGASSTSEASGLWSTDLMSFIGKKDEEKDYESAEKHESSSQPLKSLEHETGGHPKTTSEHDESNVKTLNHEEHQETNITVTEEVEIMDENHETNIVDELAHKITVIALKMDNVQKLNIGVSEEPNVDHPDRLESANHKYTSSEDQVTGTALESPFIQNPNLFGITQRQGEGKTRSSKIRFSRSRF